MAQIYLHFAELPRLKIIRLIVEADSIAEAASPDGS